MDEKMGIVLKYSDEILELIEDFNEYTQSDLQARAEAIIRCVIHELKQSKK